MRADLLRIAAELPKGDPTRREILAALQREAGTGHDILGELLDYRAFVKVYSGLRKVDAQSADLLREVWSKLSDSLDISSSERQALSRLRGIVDNPGWDPSLQRNNIFKAADLLGIRLPSAMF